MYIDIDDDGIKNFGLSIDWRCLFSELFRSQNETVSGVRIEISLKKLRRSLSIDLSRCFRRGFHFCRVKIPFIKHLSLHQGSVGCPQVIITIHRCHLLMI